MTQEIIIRGGKHTVVVVLAVTWDVGVDTVMLVEVTSISEVSADAVKVEICVMVASCTVHLGSALACIMKENSRLIKRQGRPTGVLVATTVLVWGVSMHEHRVGSIKSELELELELDVAVDEELDVDGTTEDVELMTLELEFETVYAEEVPMEAVIELVRRVVEERPVEDVVLT